MKNQFCLLQTSVKFAAWFFLKKHCYTATMFLIMKKKKSLIIAMPILMRKKTLKNNLVIVHERKILILWPTDNNQFNHDVVKKDWKI